ncbi:MAG: polymer-forming cytoskeletal protein [Myxococcota bacterium]|nr:polymer-forming cytoskeletal protein [Myxococcota bacterium]
MSNEGVPLNALLGRGATYEGDLSFEGRVRVDGLFRGRIFTEELLEVGEEGRIEGDLDAQNLVVAGFVDGRVRVRGRLVVEPTGRIQGEVRAARLVVREGARLDAQIVSGE